MGGRYPKNKNSAGAEWVGYTVLAEYNLIKTARFPKTQEPLQQGDKKTMANAEYEIHIHKKGRWIIDHIVSNDKEMAINEAREMTTDKYLSGVKVIEEAVINDEGETRTRTVFNYVKGKGKHKKKEKPESGTDSKPDKKKKKRSGATTMLIAMIGIAVLLTILIVLALVL